MTEEFISRTEALKDFESCNAENPNWTPQRVKTLLLRQPAADVAPVVRCRDCKHRTEYGNCGYPRQKVFCHRHIHTIFAATETGGLTILHWKRKPRRSLTDAAPPAVHLWIASKRQTISFARIARNG